MPKPPAPAGSPGTTTTFGSDFAGISDLDAGWSFLENSPVTPNAETTAFIQAIARRFTTPLGGLFYDANYGCDIRNFLSSGISGSAAQAAIQAEARKDERVQNATAEIDASGPPNAQVWTILISILANSGATFQFTLSVDAVTVDLLDSEQNANA
jgi:hypothetical protein